MMPCSVLTTWIPEEELAAGVKSKSQVLIYIPGKPYGLMVECCIKYFRLELLTVDAVEKYCKCAHSAFFCLFSVKVNDSPMTLNSSFITAWYPGK